MTKCVCHQMMRWWWVLSADFFTFQTHTHAHWQLFLLIDLMAIERQTDRQKSCSLVCSLSLSLSNLLNNNGWHAFKWSHLKMREREHIEWFLLSISIVLLIDYYRHRQASGKCLFHLSHSRCPDTLSRTHTKKWKSIWMKKKIRPLCGSITDMRV